ncbi:Taurine transport system permease TauC [Klebsiella pneumoniae subsp. ozaenae]|uniref:Taurine transport system permease TauC n=1 Tax=Klebsiella pneumoniae subsp. ozaenae TaxID=574 RepID=A0A378BYY1_KLEPO|nr:Taurine transport system permease TauC [Klebsiella pneumoniae subsp. ozaenae]
MSVVLNDKPRQSTLKWRWPLSPPAHPQRGDPGGIAGRLVGGRGAAAD